MNHNLKYFEIGDVPYLSSSQEIFASLGLRKKSVLKLPKFWM